MKIIVKPLLFVILLVLTFSLTIKLQNINDINADSETVAVVNDDGTVVTYRGSSEQIMRLKGYNYPTQSLKATWVSLFVGSLPKYTSEEKWKQDYTAVLDRLEEYGLNCIVFHVRTHNNALYKSELNPVATWFSTVDFDKFDPLALGAIEETHKRSIEFHAWLNPYRVYTGYCAEPFPSSNPASDSANLLSNGTTTILDPGIPAVQQFLVDTCMELVENYDVDAIHFDDYFYISDVDDSATRAKYNTDNLSLADFRRQSVDKFIESLSKEMRKYNQDHGTAVQLGIAPSGVYRNGGYASTATYNADGSLKEPLYSDTGGFAHYGDYLYADTLKWVNNEWIDYMMPQAYHALGHAASSHAALSRWWSWAVANRKVNLYMGMGIYMPTGSGSSATYWQKNKYEIRDQILNAATHPEVGGYCLYSYNYLANTNTYIKTGMDILKNDWNTVKIPCDVKQYYENILPVEDPIDLEFEDGVLSWKTSSKIRGYIIYKVPKNEALDKSDINQIYYYGNNTSVALDDMNNYVYYVGCVNLANVISDPINVNALAIDAKFVIDLISELPDVVSLDDAVALSRIQEFYDVLSQTEKAKVTNYNTYLAKVALYDVKVNCYDEASNYADLSLYAKERRVIIKNLLADFKTDLNQAASEDASNNLLTQYKQTIDSYPLVDEELREPRNTAINTLENFYNSLDLSYYTKANQNILLNELEQGITNINKALSKSEINTAQVKAAERLALVDDFKEEYDALYNEFVSDLNSFASYYLENDDYVKAYADMFNTYLQSLYEKVLTEDKEDFLNNKKTYKERYELYIDVEVETIIDFAKAIKRAKSSINSHTRDIEGLAELKEVYLAKLDQAKTKEEVESLLDSFNIKYNELSNKPTDDTPTPDNNEEKTNSCKKNVSFISFLALASLLYFIFRKRH